MNCEDELGVGRCVDLSIFRAGLKRFCYFGPKKFLPMTIPLEASSLNFQAGLGLGRAARAFYRVKQLKTAFRVGLRPKKFFAGFKISAHSRPVRFVGGPGAGRARAGLKMLRYNDAAPPCPPSRR
jgi:hypothetical protein